MEHKEKIIKSLEVLKKQAADIAIKLLDEVSPINLTEVEGIVKPFGDIEKQIDRSIKFLRSSGPIAKKSTLN